MLKINPDPTFTADVEVTIPGTGETGPLPLTFKYMGRDAYTEFVKSLEEEKDKKGKVIREEKTVSVAFQEFVVGWGLPEEFTPENVEIFLNNYPMAYPETFKAFSELLLKSRVKN